MSKLLIQYEELKKKNSKKIYIFKGGFPLSALEKYTNLLSEHHIEFEVVSNPASSPQNTSYDNIIKEIQGLDLNNTTCKEAFDILYNIQQKIKNIQ